MTNYPTSLDTFTTHHDNTGEPILATDINKIQDALTAIETELGLTPKGSSADVAARLASLLTAATAASTYAKLVGPNTLTGTWDFTGATVTGSGSLLDRGNWATSTSYAIGDVTTQGGQRYACRTAHTSGTFATDLTATKWVSLDAVAAVLTARQVISGTGLAGGGDLTADRTLSVTYGTTSGTAAQGNDTRITGALQGTSNLSDVANAGTSRTNLGLGTAATQASTAFDTAGAAATAQAASLQKTSNLSDVANATTSRANLGAAQDATRTAVKTTSYTAVAGDLVPVDTTSGNVTITLPTAPADKSRITVKHIVRGGTNTVTIATGGSDVFNAAAGATTLTLTLALQAVTAAYNASTAIWTVVSDDLALSQLDARYDATGAAASAQTASLQKTSNLSDLASPATARTNLGLGTAATLASSAVAQTANNLSDLASAPTARTNLGLGSAATLASSAVAQTANNLSDLASVGTARANLSAAQDTLRTSVKTSNYTAVAGDLVPVDTTSGNVTITLPTAPADKSRITVKQIVRGGTNTVTIATGGSDVFNVAGGSTTLTLTLALQAATVAYNASTAIWTVLADDLALSQLDSRFAGLIVIDGGSASSTFSAVPVGASYLSTTQIAADAALTSMYAQRANNLSDVASTATARTNLGLGTAATRTAGYFIGLSLGLGG